jgi:hypothetical protein
VDLKEPATKSLRPAVALQPLILGNLKAFSSVTRDIEDALAIPEAALSAPQVGL